MWEYIVVCGSEVIQECEGGEGGCECGCGQECGGAEGGWDVDVAKSVEVVRLGEGSGYGKECGSHEIGWGRGCSQKCRCSVGLVLWNWRC